MFTASLRISELENAFETPSTSEVKQHSPLCDNIFDVPRSDLFEAYQRLQSAFWDDSIVDVSLNSIPSNDLQGPVKRRSSLVVEDAQPVKLPRIDIASPPQSSPTQFEITLPLEPPPALSLPSSQTPARTLEVHPPVSTLQDVLRAPTQKVAKEGLSQQRFSELKVGLLRQLRLPLPDYDEKKVVLFLQQCQSSCTPVQKRHLVNYFTPILKATRRYPQDILLLFDQWN